MIRSAYQLLMEDYGREQVASKNSNKAQQTQL